MTVFQDDVARHMADGKGLVEAVGLAKADGRKRIDEHESVRVSGVKREAWAGARVLLWYAAVLALLVALAVWGLL